MVDPGPADEGHLRAIAGARRRSGCILITHGHPDHVEGVARLPSCSAVPCAPSTRRTPRRQPLTEPGDARPARAEIDVLATPGHTADSVCFLVEHDGERVVLTGDTILGRGTTVVAYPDGDLGDYLASLRAARRVLGAVPVLPGHGPALADCAAAAGVLPGATGGPGWTRSGRRSRPGASTAPRWSRAVYADVDRSLWPAAECRCGPSSPTWTGNRGSAPSALDQP